MEGEKKKWPYFLKFTTASPPNDILARISYFTFSLNVSIISEQKLSWVDLESWPSILLKKEVKQLCIQELAKIPPKPPKQCPEFGLHVLRFCLVNPVPLVTEYKILDAFPIRHLKASFTQCVSMCILCEGRVYPYGDA